MDADDLLEAEVIEAIVCAKRIDKTIISTSPLHPLTREKLYIIKGKTLGGRLVYTKSVIRKHGEIETFYVLVSSKKLT